MRKLPLFSAVLSLFLLVPASIIWAQTISSQKGLTTAVFPTQYGNVKVYLPDDIRPGDVISGTVIAEPNGNNARQIERNLAELQKYSISVDGNKYVVSEKPATFKWLVEQDRKLSAPLELLHVSGTKAHQLTTQFNKVDDNQAIKLICAIPSHALVDAPCKITGSFDGDASNTRCSLNNQPMQILAESPRQCVVQYPANAQGPGTMQVSENGESKCSRPISGVDMQVTTGDLNLRKGQSTYIDVKLTGLQNLPDSATLIIANVTPNVVTMTNGNLQVFIFKPFTDSEGIWEVHCPAVSIATGNFVVEINLDLPDVMLSPGPGDNQDGKCNCSITAEIVKRTVNNPRPTFAAVIQKGCSGQNCTEKGVTYLWEISSGKENGDIVDASHNKSIVTIQPKMSGKFTVKLSSTLTCSDGSTCTAVKFCNENGDVVTGPSDGGTQPEQPKIPVIDSVPTTTTTTDSIPTIGMVCSPTVVEDMNPKMVGGLKNKQTGTSSTNIIFRDDFVALEAVGSDVDQVTFLCNPLKPCPDSKSEKTIAVTGKVRFEWKITAGEGRFVKLGCGAEDEKADKGEHVMFQPPFVALPVKNADTTLTTTIELYIIDDGSPKEDPMVVKVITIKTTRKKAVPDKYTMDISGGLPDKPGSPSPKTDIGTCELIGPTWKPGDNLAVPGIILPGVTDANKMVLGQWIVLKTQDQSDPDPLVFNCTSKNCTSSGGGKSYPDNILWEWTKTGAGEFILGDKGQYIIYQAPMDMPKGKEVLEIKFKVKVMNPVGERKDPDKISKEFTIYVYQPGVKLSHPDLAWLPEEDNSLELKSELMYKIGGKWMPALSHMCRIHYFELMNVSTEKGVCLNAPIPKEADQCRDLQLKNENEQEAWDDAKASGTKCDTKELYQQARTKRPEKEYSITVYSRDFGSYGFLRSFANVNKKTSVEGKPVYISIPVTKADVAHPNGRLKKTEYADNRVTIPHDIDENRIADGGWTTTGGAKIPDPANNNEDEDDKPTGDGFKGDGLSTYEEYRGFKILDGDEVKHTRTGYLKKDIFVRNEHGLDLATYIKVSGLQVHEINETQYVDDKTRVVNSNFNTTTHANFNQMGLHLADKHRSGSLLGIAYSATGQPTIPNQEIQIRIYSLKIAESCEARKIDPGDKTVQVVAHELLHGNNVCHHGEQDPAVEKSFDLKQGLRSGNVNCVMRYDNVGTVVPGFDPEAIGSGICDSSAGTGYNAAGKLFGDAAAKRGNCKGQIRVSGKVASPKTCGNR